MTDRPDLQVELVSNPMYLCGVREMVTQISRQLGFADMQCSQIALAVDEALANVMKHGYSGSPDGRIWLKLMPISGSDGGVKIVIEDEARQVDPDKIKGRDLEDIRPGGLGVHIIREVMDQAKYEKRDKVGMRLTMVKLRSPGPSAGPTSDRSGPSAPGCGCGAGGCNG
jgi:serine/threonine-protein kinase RsbW